MKKGILCLFTCLMAVGSISAYDLKMINTTNKRIKVEATYGGPGICSDDEFNIEAKRSRKEGTGLCCLKTLRARKTVSGSPWSSRVRGKLTGYGISCTGNTFKVIENPDGSLTIERQ